MVLYTSNKQIKIEGILGYIIEHFIVIPCYFLGGIKSGIPICCVIQYCITWVLFPRFPFSLPPYYKGDPEIGYYRCLLCRTRNHKTDVKMNGVSEITYLHKLLKPFGIVDLEY